MVSYKLSLRQKLRIADERHSYTQGCLYLSLIGYCSVSLILRKSGGGSFKGSKQNRKNKMKCRGNQCKFWNPNMADAWIYAFLPHIVMGEGRVIIAILINYASVCPFYLNKSQWCKIDKGWLNWIRTVAIRIRTHYLPYVKLTLEALPKPLGLKSECTRFAHAKDV